MTNNLNTIGVMTLRENVPDFGINDLPEVPVNGSQYSSSELVQQMNRITGYLADFHSALGARYSETLALDMLVALKLVDGDIGTEQPSGRPAGYLWVDESQEDDAARPTVSDGIAQREGLTVVDAIITPLDNRLKSIEELDFVTATSFATALAGINTSLENYTLSSDLSPVATTGDAGDLTGVLDPARIPNSVLARPVTISGLIADLTQAEQDDIGNGSAVKDVNGQIWFYRSGDKTLEASYNTGSDATPDISQVTGLQDALNALLSNDPNSLSASIGAYTTQQKQGIRDALGVIVGSTPVGGEFNIEDYGADVTNTGADNLTAINIAVAAATLAGGGRIIVPLRQDAVFEVAGTIEVNHEGISFEGQGVSEQWLSTGWSDNGSILRFSHTDGPCIRYRKSACSAQHLRIDATAARIASNDAVNTGIHFEADDTSSGNNRVNFAYLNNVHVINQPGSNIALAGDMVGVYLLRSASQRSKNHGISIGRGNHVGRTNLVQNGGNIRPGIIVLDTCRTSDNEGHGYAIGHPNDAQFSPYRTYIFNHESFRNALSAGTRYSPSCDFIRAENWFVEMSAGSGRTVDTDNVVSLLTVQGINGRIREMRAISSADPAIIVKTDADLPTNGLFIDGATASGGADVANLVSFEPGVQNVTIRLPYDVGITNVTSDEANVVGLRIETSNAVRDDRDFTFLGDVDLTGATLRITGGDSDIDIGANDSGTNGQLVTLQQGDGDAAHRFVAGGQNWILGIDNSILDGFSIQDSSSLNSGAAFHIEVGGNVGIGTTAPVQKLDINGSIGVGGIGVIDASRGILHRSYTDVEIQDIANAVNTANKFTGKTVRSSTTGLLVTANGSAAGNSWKPSDGSANLVPS